VNRAYVLLALSALVIVSACSPLPFEAPPPALERYGAPVPTRSLDARAQATQPCGVLSETQLRSLALEPSGRLDPLPGGPPACVWEGPGFTQEISVALLPDRDYLVDTYRVRNNYRVFEPMVIAGLPAVAQQTTAEALTCTVTTGIALGQAVDVTATEYGAAPDPPCRTAAQVTQSVLGNLPEQPQK
jgi:hypothetical protein